MKGKNDSVIRNKIMRIIIILLFLIGAQSILTVMSKGTAVYANTNEKSDNEGEYIRLTDLDIRPESKAGWDQIRKNQDNNGNKLEINRK